MQQSMHDCCLFYYTSNNKLSGLILFHVDNFLSSGTKKFYQDVVLKLRNIYQFGKISQNDFTFTGIQIHQNEKFEIFIHQSEYSNKMEIFEYDRQHPDNLLNKIENRKIRKSTGKLNWLSSQTRPDLAFDSLNLSVA